MNAPVSAAPRSVSPWIISAPCDLAFLIATPLAIVPAVLLGAQQYFTPEQISLAVVAFASVGHHLPGFLRAYGERELFRRFRWRFLLAPPLLLAAAWTFAVRGLHGLELILLFWATWHALMQTYGFMRIYELKRGPASRLDARLDFALCLTIFAVGMIFSDARVFGVIEVLWMAGVPPLDRVWLDGLRGATAAAAAIVFGAYAVHAIVRSRSPAGIAWTKVLLALTTGFLYWMSGRLSTNVLIGVAMFEIFHAVQYYAIVWAYERRLAERAGSEFGPLRFLFQKHWAFLLLYLAAIAAFGSIRLFGEGVSDPWVQKLLLAALSASAMLHFYYDGFIWKVSERKTQVNLGVSGAAPPSRPEVSGWAHAGKWALLGLLAAALFALETCAAPRSQADQQRLLASLAAWTPDLPELQFRITRQALDQGDTAAALAAAQKAVQLRATSSLAHAGLGAAWYQAGQFAAAAAELQKAVELAPGQWRNHYELALAWEKLENWDAAENAFAAAARLAPEESAVRQAWGAMYMRRREWEAALPHLQAAQQRSPSSAEACYQSGTALVQVRRYDEARAMLEAAVAADPAHAQAHFQLGNVLYAAGQPQEAADRYRACVRLAPEFPDVYNNLGALLFEQGDLPGAAQAYRRALELQPHNAAAHYNLGLLLLNEDKFAEARREIRRAAELGQPPTPEVAAALGW